MKEERFESRNKRFKPIINIGKRENEVFIKDKVNDCYIHTEDGVVKLLNELYDENQRLKEKKSKININDYTTTGNNSFRFRIYDFIDDLIRERLDLIINERR